MIKWNYFFGKNVQKFCVSFIEQNIGEVKVDKDATDCSEDESKDVLVRNEEKEEKQEKEEEEEMETCATNRSYNKKRVCRHMRLTESSLTCAICKLVRRFFHVNSIKYIYINNIFFKFIRW